MIKFAVNKLLCLALFIFVFNLLSAQEVQQPQSNLFNDAPLSEFITALESKFAVTFYFDPSLIDGEKITVDCRGKEFNNCLQEAMEQTLLEFHQSGKQVFIFRGQPIKTNLNKTDQISMEVAETTKTQTSRDQLKQKAYKIYTIGTPGTSNSQKVKLTGFVKNFETGEPVFNASIIVAGTTKGASTNQKGYFQIELPVGHNTLQFSSVGMEPTQRIINIHSSGQLDIEMETKVNIIGDVDIFGEKNGEISTVFSGVERIEGDMLESLPALLGEPDIIKSTLMLPGVVTVGEGTAGFNVRGGKTDQNLILIDETPIFYPSHFFGNFSAINSDVVKNAILYKGSIPSNYGGRISSVYEINTIDGNSEQISGAGGVSLYSAKLMFEGPLYDKSSFIVSSRGTYSDWLLNQIKVPELYNSEVGFYDIQGKISLHINKKNRIKIGVYSSKDNFRLRSDTLYTYQNLVSNAGWEHTYNERWLSKLNFSFSSFSYDVLSKGTPARAFNIDHDVTYYGLKNYNQYKNNGNFKIYFGWESIWYKVNPGNRQNFPQSRITEFFSNTENAVEYGTFTGMEFKVVPRFSVEAGVRLSGFLSLSDGLRYEYKPNSPIDLEYLMDTITEDRNRIKQRYLNPEYRLSGNYVLGAFSSLKFGYNKTTQYIHMLTNTTAISPTDTWKLSDEYLPPQVGHQFSAGLFKNFRRFDLEASIEGFYKRIKNSKEYKPGASLVLNDHIETEILNGLGKAYGVEFSLKKSGDRLDGWIGYTCSRALLKSNSEFQEEQINNGEYFPASYDKPHNLNLFANFKASRRVIISSTLNYSTGRPITYPVAKYKLGEKLILHYSEFNQYRIPDYFRIDFSVTFKGNLKSEKLFNGSTTFSVYNVTGRKNAYSVFYKGQGDKLEGYKLSIFGTAIPTITYNFNF